MHMSEVRERARAAGVEQVGRISKGNLIRSIQRAEGNPDCFGAAWRFDCPQTDCCWRGDCLKSNPG